MKAYVIAKEFGLENLELVSRPDPRPDAEEVLVKINAVSLNFRDLLVVGGSRRITLPLVPCSDAAGVVVDVGPNTKQFRSGDRVMSTFVLGWETGEHPPIEDLLTLGGPVNGVLSEFRTWRETDLVRTPEYLTDEEAACLPCAAVSAWNALFVAGHTKPGDVVLLQGTGGVSLFALQFAKLAGAKVIVVSSSDAKLERARAIGADVCINYRTDSEWGTTARAHTDQGVDYVLDVGGASTFPQSVAAVRNAGQICSIGALSGTAEPGYRDFAQLGMKSVRVVGIRVGNRASFESMLRAIVQHEVRPTIDSTHRFIDARRAFAHLAARRHFGKVIVSM